MKAEIKGVFFDLYGTLLVYNDMERAWSDWLSTFYGCVRKHGLNLSIKEFSEKCDGFFSEPEPSIENQKLTVFERRIERLCIDLGLSLSFEDYNNIAFSCVRSWQKYVSLDPHAILVLKKIGKDKKLALITNFDFPPQVYSILRETGLFPLFDYIVVSAEIGYKKPDSRIFELALTSTRLKANEVIFIGDSPEDIEGALSTDITPVLIKRNNKYKNGILVDYDHEGKKEEYRILSHDIENIKIISDLREILKLLI
ncbi:MAG: HAD-IA family hydrolase [Candidatus Lokiarchaeota archaeon]|nr:HAD-IA family hydrolase [Candidatus Lokiarchaeota archaeon]MBD3338463.1 HAD-IA family hydrolase [Candidatus Lokiarchaeota archaeon]